MNNLKKERNNLIVQRKHLWALSKKYNTLENYDKIEIVNAQIDSINEQIAELDFEIKKGGRV